MPKKTKEVKETKSVEKVSTKKKVTKTKVTKKATKKVEVQKKVETPKETKEVKEFVQDNRTNTPKQEKPHAKAENNGPNEYTTIGDYSEEIIQKHNEKKTEADKEYEEYKKLEKAYYTKQLLWGTIYSVEPTKIGDKKSFTINLLWNNKIKIMIPDDWYWLENMYFSKSYYNKTKVENGQTKTRQSTEEEKTNIRMAIARNYVGAQICFILNSKPVRQKVEGNEMFEGEYITYAVGNRLEAINILRDKYFFHRNHKSNKEPITIKKDDIVEAHVIGVKEDMVLVEALGVETRLDCYSLTDDYITDCHSKVKPGDDIKCKVLNVEIQDNKPKLTLSGRTKDVNKQILFMKKGAYYDGTVIYFNDKTQNYTIYLENGVRASVNKDRVQGYYNLAYGDKVTVYVLKIYDTHVAGNCQFRYRP